MSCYKIFLMGGIGNQLFQITRAVSLRENGKKIEMIRLGNSKKFINLLINHKNQDDWLDIDFFLKNLQINVRTISSIELIKLFFIFIKKKMNFVVDFDISLQSRIISSKTYDVGYFQNKNQFSNSALKIVLSKLMAQLNLSKEKKIKNKLCVHIRATDFLKKGNNHQIDRMPKYHEIKEILKTYFNKKFDLLILTDDHKIIKNIICNNIKFNYQSLGAKEDFISLCQCNKMVVSQSSFSFWAYLLAKDLYDCEILNIENWSYKKLVYFLLGITK